MEKKRIICLERKTNGRMRTKWRKELRKRERNNKLKDCEQNMKEKIRSQIVIKRIRWSKERKRRTRD